MVALAVSSSVDRHHVGDGERCSLGRAGDVRLTTAHGVTDPALHAEACFIDNLGDRWTVEVPADANFEVQVRVDGQLSIVHIGEGKVFRASEAELQIETEIGTARARIDAPGALAAPRRRRSKTRVVSLRLDPTNPNHRVWIVACGDRLQRDGAAAVDFARIADTLAAGAHWEDRSLSVDAARKRSSRARQGEIDGWLEGCGDSTEDRNEIVELLVRRGVVTASLYAEVIA